VQSAAAVTRCGDVIRGLNFRVRVQTERLHIRSRTMAETFDTCGDRHEKLEVRPLLPRDWLR